MNWSEPTMSPWPSGVQSHTVMYFERERAVAPPPWNGVNVVTACSPLPSTVRTTRAASPCVWLLSVQRNTGYATLFPSGAHCCQPRTRSTPNNCFTPVTRSIAQSSSRSTPSRASAYASFLPSRVRSNDSAWAPDSVIGVPAPLMRLVPGWSGNDQSRCAWVSFVNAMRLPSGETAGPLCTPPPVVIRSVVNCSSV